MGSCVRKVNSQAVSNSRSKKSKPTIINSASQTGDLAEPQKDFYAHLKEEARKNEEILKAKREANSLPVINLPFFTKESMNQKDRGVLREFIESNNLLKVHEYIQAQKIAPHEELSTEGYRWTAIHYACHNKSKFILEYLCRLVFQNHPADYEKILNSHTYEGYTPLIVIAREADFEVAETLLNFGGIDIEAKDKKGVIAYKHALSAKKKEIIELLDSKKDFKTVNKEALQAISTDQFFEQWKSNIISKRESKLNWRETPSNEETLNSILNSNNSDVYKITKQCIESSQNFIDPTFPHNLQEFAAKSDDERYTQWTLARWLRPHELFNASYSEIKLFEKIDPTSIRQGQLDTCHFLSVISALAEFPERIHRIFQQNTSNKYGAYAVNFYLNGKPQEVIIDDYFPCYQDKLEPIFAKPDGKQLWVLVLEKAWCKMFGSYSIVEIEVVFEAMEDILGAPSKGIWTKTFEMGALFNMLLEYHKNRFLISGTTWDNISETDGIVASHTYSILGVYEVNSKKTNQLLKLRNPWGFIEWQGQFKDGSDNLTEEIKDATEYVEKEDDGIFIMTLEEFYYRFAHISVCFYYDKWIYQYFEINSRKSSYFVIKIEKKQRISIRVHQENKKLYNFKHSEYEYSPVQVILFSKSRGILEMGADGKYFGGKSILINNEGFVNLGIGEYFLRVKVHFPPKKEKPIIVSTYSADKIFFEQIDYQIGKSIFFWSLITFSREFANPTKFQNGKCELKFDWVDYLGIIYIKNTLCNSWKITIRIENEVNLKISKKGRDEAKELKAELSSGKEDIFLVKKLELYKAAKFTQKVFESQY